MLINGKVRQACSALVDKLGEPGAPITLEPMTKFPLVRDLFVDRQRLFKDLKRVKAWVPIDGTYDLGPGPPISQDLQEERYPLSRCISCGCCLEACPQYTPGQRVRRGRDHQPGAAVQRPPDRRGAEGRAAGCDDGGRRGFANAARPATAWKCARRTFPLLESIADGAAPGNGACGQAVLQ